MDELKLKIKEVIINSLQLEDIKPENISDSEPLFGDGLGLDSIDALELGVALKKEFKVSFSQDSAENKNAFESVKSLAEYISKNSGE
ncbi:MAG: acyl carrier protein [Treponema sp.]|nr:acyl carrier protein [Treponema sp.]